MLDKEGKTTHCLLDEFVPAVVIGDVMSHRDPVDTLAPRALEGACQPHMRKSQGKLLQHCR